MFRQKRDIPEGFVEESRLSTAGPSSQRGQSSTIPNRYLAGTYAVLKGPQVSSTKRGNTVLCSSDLNLVAQERQPVSFADIEKAIGAT